MASDVCSLPRFRKECSFCQYSVKLTHNFCPQCGTEVPNDDDNPYDERAVITAYFRKGFEYARIVQMLQKEHDSKYVMTVSMYDM